MIIPNPKITWVMGLICNMDYLLKSWKRGEGRKDENLRCHRLKKAIVLKFINTRDSTENSGETKKEMYKEISKVLKVTYT